MRFRRIILGRTLFILLSLIGVTCITTPVKAAHSSWKGYHYVTFKKSATVSRMVPTGISIGTGNFVDNQYTVPAGYRYKVKYTENAIYPWRINSGRFKSTSTAFYTVQKSDNDFTWYHLSLSKYAVFHGYRILTYASQHYNTTYAGGHILSDYYPIQKTKVIFSYDSHVLPTHHIWIAAMSPNSSSRYAYAYAYSQGAWHHYGVYNSATNKITKD